MKYSRNCECITAIYTCLQKIACFVPELRYVLGTYVSFTQDFPLRLPAVFPSQVPVVMHAEMMLNQVLK